MKKTTITFVAAIAVLLFSVGLLTSQVVIERRQMDSSGFPIGMGFGTALPTVANDGRPPVDGELFSLRTTGADPVVRLFNDFESTWNTVANVSVGNSWAIHRDDFCGVGVLQNDGTVESGVDTEINDITTIVAKNGYYQFIEQTATLSLATNPNVAGAGCGLDVSGDVTANDGHELIFHHERLGAVYLVDSATDVFYFEISITIANISGFDGDWAAGMMLPEAQVNPPVHDNLNTYILFTLSDNAGDLDLEADVDGGGLANDDTGITWADGETRVLRIEIDGDGYAAYVDGTAVTTTNVNTSNDFSDGDKVIPFYYHTQGAEGVATGVVLNYIEWGYGAL